MNSCIIAIAEMFANFFNWRTTAIENQASSEIIQDKHDSEKACLYAEKAFDVVALSARFNNSKLQKRYKRYVKLFRKYR